MRLKVFFKRYPWVGFAALVVLAVLLPIHFSKAEGVISDALTEGFVKLVTWLLGVVIQFLGMVIIFLVSILISFAQYNSFGSAFPVQTGWVIVRDVCNMFFIVILLVSAFSTIIGYDSSFHYKAVLPKLLLMAILINFSKTLVMLMIDFSQVVMLTFVNAFSQAAAGNFINAFQLQGYANISPTAAAAANPINIVLSYLLGIVMSIIVVGIMIVFIAFIIARIVGLWILLIFSPAAFFVTALPGKLSKSLGSLSSDYWNRLGSLLTGGPVIAFFLWLTLATVQAGASDPSVLAQPLGLSVTGATDARLTGFLSQVGNTQSLGLFIVAVSMMLMGLDAAVKAAESVGSGTLKSFAGYVKTKTMDYAKLAAKSPYLAARGTAGAIDRRADITGKASMLGMATLGRIPVARSLLRKPLMAGMAKNKLQTEAEAEEITKGMKNLSPKQKALFAGSIPTSMLLGATPAEQQAYAGVMMDRASDANMKKMEKELGASYEKELLTQGAGKDEAKSRATKMAKSDVMARRAQFLKSADDVAKGDQKGEIEKILKENPHLYVAKSMDDYAKNAKKIADDPELLNKISADSKSSMKFLVGGLLDEALIRQDPKDRNSKIIGIDGAKRDSLMAKVKDGELKDKLEAAMGFIGNSPNGVEMKDIQDGLVQKDKSGSMRIYNAPVDQDKLGSYLKRSGRQEFSEVLNVEVGTGGKQLYSGNEKAARSFLDATMVNDVTKGRQSPGILDDSASTAVNSAISSGMRLEEVLEAGNNSSDQAITGRISANVNDAVREAGASTDKAGFDSKINPQISYLNQIDQPGVDSKAQIKILSGLHKGDAAKMISEKWDIADRKQKQAFEKAIKVAVARAEDIAGKRAAGGAVSADEADVEALVEQLRKELPRHAERDPADSKIILKDAAPQSLSKILHET